MPHASATSKLTLRAREGARFTCSGSGLCCTDLHGLGLLTKSEVRDLKKRNPLSVVYNEELEGFCIKPVDSHCIYLEHERCSIHAQSGPAAKPGGCRRFPYGLVRTPHGGRITTEHRCPCRTLGDRPLISIEDADASLRDRAGRLDVDFDVPTRIAIQKGKRVSFDAYVKLESQLIARLNAGERAEEVLAATALPTLASSTWPSIAVEHINTRDSTTGGEAFGWFGDALLHLSGGHTPPQRPRPWHASFARALASGSEPPDPETIYNDWLADEIWMFRWLPWGPFDVARAELATRLTVGRCVQGWIERHGVSPSQAAAEAVMICELAAEGSEWPSAVASIQRLPSPAKSL